MKNIKLGIVQIVKLIVGLIASGVAISVPFINGDFYGGSVGAPIGYPMLAVLFYGVIAFLIILGVNLAKDKSSVKRDSLLFASLVGLIILNGGLISVFGKYGMIVDIIFSLIACGLFIAPFYFSLKKS